MGRESFLERNKHKLAALVALGSIAYEHPKLNEPVTDSVEATTTDPDASRTISQVNHAEFNSTQLTSTDETASPEPTSPTPIEAEREYPLNEAEKRLIAQHNITILPEHTTARGGIIGYYQGKKYQYDLFINKEADNNFVLGELLPGGTIFPGGADSEREVGAFQTLDALLEISDRFYRMNELRHTLSEAAISPEGQLNQAAAEKYNQWIDAEYTPYLKTTGLPYPNVDMLKINIGAFDDNKQE